MRIEGQRFDEHSVCTHHGRPEPATHVDHIDPHLRDRWFFWNFENWQSLCARCHGRKTTLRDGGLGNPV
jgi:5-methylcytosine-specific restriction endonuclease McrA